MLTIGLRHRPRAERVGYLRVSRQDFGRLNHLLDNRAGVDKVWEQDAKRLEATLREMPDAKRAAREASHTVCPEQSERVKCTLCWHALDL